MEMKDILLRIESRLDDLTKAFHQLKSENEILRKEILGISYSIPWFTAVLSSCTMKLSNFLESTLTDPQYCFCDGSKNSRPTRVVGNFSEEFSFSGGKDRCEFLSDVPTNQLLLSTLYSMPPAPDVWMMAKEYSKTPLELFVSHGNLLVRVGTSGRFSCNIEIANCLNVPLRNRNKWYSNSNKNDFWPLEIQSFHRESFLGSSVTNFDAIFAYEIVSTDLALIIALKVGPGTNSFAAAFSQIPAVNGKNELEALMNPNEWKIHNYKKCSNASKALEVISDRNIRAEILMTEKEESIFIIRIYAV
ncbi:unnamed protein product [Allacma fusca]|uniref:Uncharacterized protein n=1 Tax=Allacma fusca TaxID=39272 RepID=A0A8J2LH57_9HEXA|nr:unnamed protein product [Allacma fusca]